MNVHSLKAKKNGPELVGQQLEEFIRTHLRIYLQPVTKRIESIALAYGIGLTKLDAATQEAELSRLTKQKLAEMVKKSETLDECIITRNGV